MEPTSEFELRSMTCSSVQSPMSEGSFPVRLAPEMTSFLREGKEERLDGIGSSREMDWIVISVTKPLGEHVMEDQLHGLESRMFQLEKEDDEDKEEEAEECSQEKRSEASWFEAAKVEEMRNR